MLALLSLWGAASPALAQVNVEGLRQQLGPEAFRAKLDAAVTGYEGNTQGIVLGGGLFFGGRSGQHLAYVNATRPFAPEPTSAGVTQFRPPEIQLRARMQTLVRSNAISVTF